MTTDTATNSHPNFHGSFRLLFDEITSKPRLIAGKDPDIAQGPDLVTSVIDSGLCFPLLP